MTEEYLQYNDLAETLKALAHPVRLCIVKNLLEKGECNVTYMQTCLDTPQSTISQHLQKLKASGIVDKRRSGVEVYYKIHSLKIKGLINELFS